MEKDFNRLKEMSSKKSWMIKIFFWISLKGNAVMLLH